jgi:hypothetical protein
MSDGDVEPAVTIGSVDTDAIGISSDREARLDLLLAEELSVDHGLTRWFLAEAGRWRDRRPWPGGDLEGVRARVNYWDAGPEIPPDAEGETDVDLTLWWSGGAELPVLIEDKVAAVFQPRQAERYATRAQARGGVAVLVGPEAYLDSHPREVEIFHGAVSVEEIVARIQAHPAAQDPVTKRRAKWRARLLEELIRPPVVPTVSDPDTVEFTEFCAAWLAEHAPAAIPNSRSCHTAGQGWLWFESPRGLGYKACGWAKKPNAAVDLYVADHGFSGTAGELELLIERLGVPAGFFVTTDTASPPNVVLRFECQKVLPSDGRPEPGSDSERAVIQGLEACAASTAWVRHHEDRLGESGQRAV